MCVEGIAAIDSNGDNSPPWHLQAKIKEALNSKPWM
jgi:hypothetical protein